MAGNYRFDNPDSALSTLAENLSTVGAATSSTALTGRVLAEPIHADRDSPAADVSAMDGYAVRMADLQTDRPIPVNGECVPGAPPVPLPPGSTVRIFTGAIVPDDAELVIKREDTIESQSEIQFQDSATACTVGAHIRRTGENARAGSTVLDAGTRLTAAQRATMANFGCEQAKIYRAVSVTIITTGDEVGVPAGVTPKPWQLRNSNRASLSALLESVPWIVVNRVEHAVDNRDELQSLLETSIADSDAILLTGGVSMGDYDYVPDVIRDLGAEIVFHGLPIRPGKPILGASTDDGKLILGLPGNPVSATVGCRRMAIPLLSKMSGQTMWRPPCPVVRLSNPGPRTIPLHWMKLARLTEPGIAEVVISQGSGDLVSLGQSHGFVETPPDQTGEGPWPFYGWSF